MRALPAPLVYVRTLLVFGVVWHLVAAWIGNRALLPPPLAVVQSIWLHVRDFELFEHALVSLWRMVVAVGLAAAVALPLGFAMGLNRAIEQVVDPVVEMLRPISGIAWIPLALFMFGIGNLLPIYIMFYASFFPLLLGTIAGARGVDRRLIDAARTMGVPRAAIVARVVVPGAIPAVLVALRLAIAGAWTAVVAAELVGAPSGLGYAIEWYRELLFTPSVMAFIAMIGVLGFLMDLGLRRLQSLLTPWAPPAESL